MILRLSSESGCLTVVQTELALSHLEQIVSRFLESRGELPPPSAARGLEIGQRQFYAWMTFGQFNCCRFMATFQVAFTNRASQGLLNFYGLLNIFYKAAFEWFSLWIARDLRRQLSEFYWWLSIRNDWTLCQMILDQAQVRGRAIDTTPVTGSYLTRLVTRDGPRTWHQTRPFRARANLAFVSFSKKSFVKALYHVSMLVSLGKAL